MRIILDFLRTRDACAFGLIVYGCSCSRFTAIGGMSLLRPQIFISARICTRIAHGMAAVKKEADPEPTVAISEIQTVYQPRRPLPKPTNIDLGVAKTTVDDWQVMGPNGRFNAYLQVTFDVFV